MNWVDAESKIKPSINRVVLAYCPEWCDSGYQVCFWNGKVFMYEDQPNNNFHSYVDKWSIFLEAD